MRVIVIEGARGVGKTTLSCLLRDRIEYSSLLKLCGLPKCKGEKERVYQYHKAVIEYVRNISKLNSESTLILDRSMLSEEVMSFLYKDYSFTEEMLQLLSQLNSISELKIIILKLDDKKELEERLNRNKVEYYNISYDIEKSLREQSKYKSIYLDLLSMGYVVKMLDTNCNIENLIKNIV